MAMMNGVMCRSFRRRLGGDRLGAISSSLRIAGRLINAAGRSLSLLGGSLRLAGSSLSARGGLIGALRRVLGSLRRIGLVGRASHQQRKG